MHQPAENNDEGGCPEATADELQEISAVAKNNQHPQQSSAKYGMGTGYQTSTTLDQLSLHNERINTYQNTQMVSSSIDKSMITHQSKQTLKKPTFGLYRGSPVPAARRSHEDVMAVMRNNNAHVSCSSTTDLVHLQASSQRYLFN